ncbi:unnamed protein product [Linum tenue]|uniref:Uncharacterized protein n=1 Tax=Linum tenue TaxID=586396 RepID=A0AAV0M7Z5_9ROSI|nr:unnamed protein product [Linum tenue]
MSQLYCEDGFNAVFVSPGVEYWFKTLKVFDLFGQSIEEIHNCLVFRSIRFKATLLNLSFWFILGKFDSGVEMAVYFIRLMFDFAPFADRCAQGCNVLRGMLRGCKEGANQNGRGGVVRHRHEGAESYRERKCAAGCGAPDCVENREEDFILGSSRSTCCCCRNKGRLDDGESTVTAA